MCYFDLLTFVVHCVHKCFAAPHKPSGCTLLVKLDSGCCNSKTLDFLGQTKAKKAASNQKLSQTFPEINLQQTEL